MSLIKWGCHTGEQYNTWDLISDVYNLTLAGVEIVLLKVLHTRPRVLYALPRIASWWMFQLRLSLLNYNSKILMIMGGVNGVTSNIIWCKNSVIEWKMATLGRIER